MKCQLYRITEQDLQRMVKESVNRILTTRKKIFEGIENVEDNELLLNDEESQEYNGVNDEWYQEEDYDGNVGSEGMVRSYDIGAYYLSNAEQDAKENGFDNVEDYLKYWFDEVKPDCPWYWQKIGSGYGYNGNTIFREGGIVCKDISGQIMVDEYPIGAVERNADFENRLSQGEYWMK